MADHPLPPGFRSSSLRQLVGYMRRPYEFMEAGRQRFGTPFTARFASYGTFVFLSDPAAIRDVFRGDPRVLHSGEANAFMADSVGPNSLLVLDDQAHAHQRRPQIPPFHGDRMRAHGEAMRRATLDRMRGWKRGDRLWLEDECLAITLEIILRRIFGVEDRDRLERLALPVRRLMGMIGHPWGLLSTLVPEPLRPLTLWRPIRATLAAIDREIYELIAERRESSDGSQDVLSALLAMTHEDGQPLTDRELRDHLFTNLLAGHDTTAVSLGWAFVHLLEHPAALERLQAELEREVPDGRVGVEELERLPYLDAALRESMRLRPVVAFVSRLLKQDFSAGGVTYPAGVSLSPTTLLAHFEPASHPEPRTYRPERFVDRKPDPATWFPFGGGARRCLGMAFALFEMRVVLATILSHARLDRSGARSGVRRKGLLLAPTDRARATVTRVTVEEPAAVG